MAGESGEFSTGHQEEKHIPHRKQEVQQRAIDRVKELLARFFTRRRMRTRAQEPVRREPQPRPASLGQEPQMPPEPDKLPEEGGEGEEEQRTPSEHFNRQNAREMASLAEQSTSSLQILPGDQWSMHYPNGVDERARAIESLFAGTADPISEIVNVTPEALFYDQDDLTTRGFAEVRDRIMDIVTSHENYNYGRFTEFLSDMHGTNIDAAFAQRLYNTLAYDRIRHVMLDQYHGEDHARVVDAVRGEVQATPGQLRSMQGMEQILASMRVTTYAESHNLASRTLQSNVESRLSKPDAVIAAELQDSYSEFVQSGNQDAYETLVRSIQQYYQDNEQQQQQQEPEESEEESLPPHTNEYKPPSETESDTSRFFEVTPQGAEQPLTGMYPFGKRSVFDKTSLTWKDSGVKQAYIAAVAGDKRHTMTNIPAITKAELYDIPVPDDYTLDYSSLQVSGTDAKLLRDQDGCFFIQGSDVGTFTVDVVATAHRVNRAPQAADHEKIHEGNFGDDTEALLGDIRSAGLGPRDTIERIDAFLNERHQYPSAEELKTLQANILDKSTGETFFQNLEESDILDCYLGNNLAIAMLRDAGVPARLVQGHAVTEATDGKAVIDSSTGHAWAEYWDGTQWVVHDFTPKTPSDDAQEKQAQQSKEGEGQEDQQDEQQQEEGEQGEKKQGEEEGEGDDQQQADQASGQQDGADGQAVPGEVDGNPKEGIHPPELPPVDNGSNFFPSAFSDGDEVINQAINDLQAAGGAIQESRERRQELQPQIEGVESFRDVQRIREEVLEDEQLFNDIKEQLKETLDAREQIMKDQMLDQLAQMADEGFLDEEQEAAAREMIQQADTADLDALKQEIAEESSLYDEFQHIRDEIEPLVDDWFNYFVDKLPREDKVTYDDTVSVKRGRLDENALLNPSKYITGDVFSPRVIRPEIQAKFLASVVVDISGSMVLDALDQPDPTKLNNAKKLLVFYNELFSRISENYGYIKYANYAFSESVHVIKRFEQQYSSSKRYDYDGMESATVKARLMRTMRPGGKTDMLLAVRTAAGDLNEVKELFPDYVSALYYVGDGEDSWGNQAKIREFLRLAEQEEGFGDHQVHATMLGDEQQRKQLSDVFGDRNTAVAPTLEALIEKSMEQFEDDMEEFLLANQR